MGHLLYLMFRCDFDVMESLESLENLWEVNTAEIKIQRDECERWKRKQTFTAANAERTGRLRPHTHRVNVNSVVALTRGAANGSRSLWTHMRRGGAQRPR